MENKEEEDAIDLLGIEEPDILVEDDEEMDARIELELKKRKAEMQV